MTSIGIDETFCKKRHRDDPDKVKNFCYDMSPAIIRGITDNSPKPQITFDKYYLIQTVNKAVDEVRRDDRKNPNPSFLKEPGFCG